jgi:hypothetical protein
LTEPPFSALPRSSGRFAFPPTYSADNQPVKAFSRAMSGTHDRTAPESISNAFRHLSFAITLTGAPVVDPAALICTQFHLDDHAAALPAPSPPSPLRRSSPACPREPRLASAARRVQAHGGPAKVAQGKAVMDEEEIVKFGPEAKHLTDTIKMVAYRAETALVRCLAPHYARTDDEGRALIREMLSSSVDVLPDAQHLRIRLHSLANPRSNQALAPRVRDTQRARASVPGNEPDWSMKRRCCTNSCAHVRSPEFSGASWAARGRSGVYSPPSPPGRTGA